MTALEKYLAEVKAQIHQDFKSIHFSDINRLVAMVEMAYGRFATLLRACEVCEGLNDTGSLRARATKMHIEDTFAALDRLAANGEGGT